MAVPENINQDFVGTAVNFYCDLRINGHQVITYNIIHMAIREWVFDMIPRIELTISDDGMFTEAYPLNDGDIISVDLRKNDHDKDAIKLEFIVLLHSVGTYMGNKATQIHMYGALNVPELYNPIKNRSFKSRNSLDVILQILNVEGKQNIVTPTGFTPNDVMTWIQANQNNLDMLKHVLKRAYKTDDGMLLFGNTKGEFTYTSINTELSKQINRTARFNLENYSANSFESTADLNDIWFNNYAIYDYNSYMNRLINYGLQYNYYSTKDGSVNGNISKDSHQLTDLSNKNPTNKDKMSQNVNLGYLPYDNVFDDYYLAMMQNKYYLSDFFGQKFIEINVNSLTKPRLMEKIDLMLPSFIGADFTNSSFSGEYIISGIFHEVSRGNIYVEKIFLSRNGQNKSIVGTSKNSESEFVSA